jgi:hypothetical protein
MWNLQLKEDGQLSEQLLRDLDHRSLNAYFEWSLQLKEDGLTVRTTPKRPGPQDSYRIF